MITISYFHKTLGRFAQERSTGPQERARLSEPREESGDTSHKRVTVSFKTANANVKFPQYVRNKALKELQVSKKFFVHLILFVILRVNLIF